MSYFKDSNSMRRTPATSGEATIYVLNTTWRERSATELLQENALLARMVKDIQVEVAQLTAQLARSRGLARTPRSAANG